MAKKPTTPDDLSQDLLLKEVDEEVRAQRMNEWWNRFGNWVIGGAFVIVMATIGYEFQASQQQEAQETATSALLKAQNLIEQQQTNEAIAALEPTKSANGVHLLGELRRAALLDAQAKHDDAKAVFVAVTEQATSHKAIANYAALHVGGYDQIDAGEPYYALSRELQAMDLLDQKKHTEAAELITAMLPDPSITPAQHERLLLLLNEAQQ